MGGKKKGRHSYKVLVGAFILFTAVLFGGTLAIPYLTGLRTVHIPADASIDVQPWMELVPSTADTVDFANVSYAISVGLNTSTQSPILDITETGQTLTLSNITYLFSYGIPATNPNTNETGVDVYAVPANVYSSLQDAVSTATTIKPQTYKNHEIYQILDNVSQGQLEVAAITFYDGYVFYSQGAQNSLQQVEAGLDVPLDQETSLFSNRTVQLAVYAVAGNGTGYIALHYIGYSAEISGANYATKAVFGSPNGYNSTYAFGFSSASQASSKSGLVTSTYERGLDYYLLDNFVVAKVTVYPQEFFIEMMAF